ncbi:hypothetical protein Tco_0666079 [Tanacetum coccineum]
MFKSEFLDNDMKEAFPGWFGKQIRQRHVDNDPGVSENSELFALACGPITNHNLSQLLRSQRCEMSADVARGHGGDGGGDDRPPSHQIPTGCGGCVGNMRYPDASSEHAAHWANYLGEIVREMPLHYPSWRQVPPEQKAGVMDRIGTQFDMRPHMESDRWPLIYAAIQQHLQKIYNGKKAALKERIGFPGLGRGTYGPGENRLSRPSQIS